MALKLRDYQDQCVKDTMKSLIEIKGNPVIEMATGLGKSITIAGIVMECRLTWSAINVLVLCHRAKLVEQDAEKFVALGMIPSIYCAELNRKEVGQFTIGTILSVANNAQLFQDVHLVIVDEVQTINNEDEGVYRKFLSGLPKAKIIGLSATPYRLKGGAVYGKGRLFSHRCFKMGFAEGVKRGFLTPPINYDANWEDKYDDIRITAGDFNQKDINSHFTKIVDRSCVDLSNRMKNRHYVLVFACSIAHAEAIVTCLRSLGEQARVYHSEMGIIEDKMTITAFQNRQFKYLVSIDKLGVGFDAPFVDGLGIMRPTMSRGLAIQMLGRGSRLYPDKTNFLVADYAGNIVRHNLLNPDLYDVPYEEIKKVRKTGDAPHKTCPNCQAILGTRVNVCDCGYKFPPKITTVAAFDSENGETKTIQINGWMPRIDTNSKHSFVSLQIATKDTLESYKFSWFPEDTGYSKTKSMLSYQKLFGELPPQMTCRSWYDCLKVLEWRYKEADIQKENGYWKLIGVR